MKGKGTTDVVFIVRQMQEKLAFNLSSTKCVCKMAFVQMNSMAAYFIMTIILFFCHILLAFSALTLLVGRQEGHPACKKTEWWDVDVVVWDEAQACI